MLYSLFLLLLLISQSTFAFPPDSKPCDASVNIRTSFGTNSPVPLNPCVPTLAYDDTTIALVWNKPDNYANNIVDFNVYADGKKLGSASSPNAGNSAVIAYIKQFYALDEAKFHTKIIFHNFLATGLLPNTKYMFTVRSVDAKGRESADSAIVVQTTAPAFTRIYNVASLGAKGDGRTNNTAVIQKAIDDCSANSTSAYGCKVLIPANATGGSVFLTGALLLNSNMTLEIAEGATLKASENTLDFPLWKGKSGKAPALLNAMANKKYANIRLTGKGTLDGSGWAQGADQTDELGRPLPYYEIGNSSSWATLGALAKSQMAAAVGNSTDSAVLSAAYSTFRSSLVAIQKAENVYIGNMRFTNPAFHGITCLPCTNFVMANSVVLTFNVNNGDGLEYRGNNSIMFNNFMHCGDDNFNFANGRGKDAQLANGPTQFVWIFNNYMREGHGAVVFGSPTAGWIQDVLAEDNVMFLTDNGLRFKSTPPTGGGARRVMFRDSAMREIGTSGSVKVGKCEVDNYNSDAGGNPFVFTLSYQFAVSGFTPATSCAQFKDIVVQRVTLDNGKPNDSGNATIKVDGYGGEDKSLGYPATYHTNITFNSVHIKNMNPVNISRLANSTFEDVTMANWGNQSSPWAITDSVGLKFSNVKPMPSQGDD